MQKALSAALGQKGQKLDIGNGMLNAAAGAAVEMEAAKALQYTLFQGGQGIRVVFSGVEADDIGMGRTVPKRIKIPHHQIRRDVCLLQHLKTAVHGNHIVVGGKGEVKPRIFPRAYQIADSLSHNKPPPSNPQLLPGKAGQDIRQIYFLF